jgi:hypothetical protein
MILDVSTRSICCIWMHQDESGQRSLCWSVSVYITGAELHLDVSTTLQRPQLHLDVSGQQEPLLLLNVSTPQGPDLIYTAAAYAVPGWLPLQNVATKGPATKGPATKGPVTKSPGY